MCKDCEKKANIFRSTVIGLLSKLAPVSYADDGNGDGTGNNVPNGSSEPGGNSGGAPSVPQINYEDLVARARKEEKDKLYGQIRGLKDDLKLMTKSNNDNLLKVGQLQAELDALKSGGDSEEVTQLKNKITSLETEIANLKSSAVDEKTLRESIEAEFKADYEVKLYRIEKLGTEDVKNGVLPMFLDAITGKTKEEIDASIQEAMNKTAQAREQLGIKSDGGSSATNTNTSPASTHSFGNTVVNPVDPSHSAFEGATDFDFVRNLDLNNPEDFKKYKEWKSKVGLR